MKRPTCFTAKPYKAPDSHSGHCLIYPTDVGELKFGELSQLTGIAKNTLRSRLSDLHWMHPEILTRKKRRGQPRVAVERNGIMVMEAFGNEEWRGLSDKSRDMKIYKIKVGTWEARQ